MIVFKEKVFSIQSGNYEGTRRIPGKKTRTGGTSTPGLAGFLNGGEIDKINITDLLKDQDAFASWMSGIAAQSLFNEGKSVKPGTWKADSSIEKKYKYDIDKNPKDFTVSILYAGNSMVIFINNPGKKELSKLNDILSNYCFSHRRADYASEKVGRNIYLVDLYISSRSENDIILDLLGAGFRLNIITGNRFKGR